MNSNDDSDLLKRIISSTCTSEEKAIYLDKNDDCIVINATETYEYYIPLHRCETHKDILGWTFQLSEKNWMTRDDLREFIKIASVANNLDIPMI